jgi:prolyl-tRNA synthetase
VKPLEEVATPGMETIEEVAGYLGVPVHRTLKAVFYSAGGEVVFAVIRGDLEVNEAKLASLLRVPELRLATEEELVAVGIVVGYASPRGLGDGIKVVADDSIGLGANFVMGANREGYHFRNANYPRDFEVDVTGDIALVEDGHLCPFCGGGLELERGIELGHIFQLGTKYSESMGARFLDAQGEEHPLVMGCYGIGLDRLMAACVEQNHDERGIRWPVSLAPADVYLVALGGRSGEVSSAAEGLYAELAEQGYRVIYDDRRESVGVKFNDADLIGLPVRLTVSQRTLAQGGVELKRRDEETYRIVPHADLAAEIQKALAEG